MSQYPLKGAISTFRGSGTFLTQCECLLEDLFQYTSGADEDKKISELARFAWNSFIPQDESCSRFTYLIERVRLLNIRACFDESDDRSLGGVDLREGFRMFAAAHRTATCANENTID